MAEGQLIRVRQRKAMPSIETGRRVVAIEDIRRVVQHAYPAVLIGHVESLPERVCSPHQEPVLEWAGQLQLHRVILRFQNSTPQQGGCSPSERFEKHTSLLTTPGGGDIQLEISEAARGLRADVGRIDRHVERKTALEGNVP